MRRVFRTPALPLHHPVTLLATWFGAGLVARAPGTCGSLAALPCGLLLVWAGGPCLLAGATVAIGAVGVWASGRYAAAREDGDPGDVVIDEVTGMWLALLPAALDPVLAAAAFLAFRVVDIAKPWPIGWADRRIGGGVGIMLDDVLGGIMAALVVLLLRVFVEI